MERQSKRKGNTTPYSPHHLGTDVIHKDVHYSTMFLKNILQKRSFSKCYLDLKQWQLTQGKGDTDEFRGPGRTYNTPSTQYLQGIGSCTPLLLGIKSMDVQVPLYKMAQYNQPSISCRGGTCGYGAVLCLVTYNFLRLHGL